MESLQIDPEGRFLFVKGTLLGVRYTFASIYAPNDGTVNCLAKTLRILEKFREGCLILGGDFNLTLDPSMDTSTGRTALSFWALKQVKQLLSSQHLVDSWRTAYRN